MSHKKPNWLGDDGEFKNPIPVVNSASVQQKLKSSTHDDANQAAYGFVILLLVSFLLLMICSSTVMSTSRSTSSDENRTRASETCHMTDSQFQYRISFAKSPDEINEIVEYYYLYCR